LVSGTKKYLIEKKRVRKINYKQDFMKKNPHVKMAHPTQVAPQMKNTLTPKLAALMPSTPVVVGLTR
jgi:hypothetical protein